MTLVRTHKRPLNRQIHEATAIDTSNAHIIMNSKNEYNGAKVPRITVEVGSRVYTTGYVGQGVPEAAPSPTITTPAPLTTRQDSNLVQQQLDVQGGDGDEEELEAQR